MGFINAHVIFCAALNYTFACDPASPLHILQPLYTDPVLLATKMKKKHSELLTTQYQSVSVTRVLATQPPSSTCTLLWRLRQVSGAECDARDRRAHSLKCSPRAPFQESPPTSSPLHSKDMIQAFTFYFIR